MLDSYPEIEGAGEPSNGNEALVTVKKLRPKVSCSDGLLEGPSAASPERRGGRAPLSKN